MKTQQFRIGDLTIGGGAPILVQSMCNTRTIDIDATVQQIRRLSGAGCDLVRLAIQSVNEAKAIRTIKKQVLTPIVADIAFDYRLAIEAIRHGADKVRITPSNIGSPEKVREIVAAVIDRNAAVRIGVNSGSLDTDLVAKYGRERMPEAMVEAVLRELDLVTSMGLQKIVISAKATSVPETLKTYRLLAEKANFPLHIGVTEAGTRSTGAIRSAVGIGTLLAEGIGDTVRVSLSADPVEEVVVAWQILKALKLRERGCTIVSCPTCGRTAIDIVRLAEEIEAATATIAENLIIAVMGCVINGPGEAQRADVAVVGGKGVATVYRSGKKILQVKQNAVISAVLEQIEILKNERLQAAALTSREQ